MDILQFINNGALILVPILYVIGMLIKGIPQIKDWLIPFILLAFGIIGAIALLGFSLASIFQGILVSGAAVYTNQLIKQGIERK